MAMFLKEELSSEMKKEYNRNYLKDNAIIQKLTQIFEIMINADVKPVNPMNFIREQLGAKTIPKEELDDMEQRLDDLHREKRKLRNILRKLGVNDADIDLDVSPFPIDDHLENGPTAEHQFNEISDIKFLK